MGLKTYDEAVNWLEKAIADDPGFGTTLQALAAAYQLAGMPEKAAESMRVYLHQTPDYSLSVYENTSPFVDPELRRVAGQAMVAAGLPMG